MEDAPKDEEQVVTPAQRIKLAIERVKDIKNFINVSDVAKLEVICRFYEQNPESDDAKDVYEAFTAVEGVINQAQEHPDDRRLQEALDETMKTFRGTVEGEYNRLGNSMQQKTPEGVAKWEKLLKGE